MWHEIICKTNFNIGILGPFNKTDLVSVLPVKNSAGGIFLKIIVYVTQSQNELFPSCFVEQAYTSRRLCRNYLTHKEHVFIRY